MLYSLGKLLLGFGLLLAAAGLILMFAQHIPGIGRLPGDIIIRKKNFTFYFPLATGLVLSLILSLILWLMGRK